MKPITDYDDDKYRCKKVLLKDRFYRALDDLVRSFKAVGFVTSEGKLSTKCGKSDGYFRMCRKMKHMPNYDVITKLSNYIAIFLSKTDFDESFFDRDKIVKHFTYLRKELEQVKRTIALQFPAYMDLDKTIDLNLKETDEELKLEEEYNKWIGHICFLWNDKEEDGQYRILKRICGAYFYSDYWAVPFKHCRPARRDEIKFYEEEDK